MGNIFGCPVADRNRNAKPFRLDRNRGARLSAASLNLLNESVHCDRKSTQIQVGQQPDLPAGQV